MSKGVVLLCIFAGFLVGWSRYITQLWRSGTLHIMACVHQTSANCLMPVTCWLSAVSREPNAVSQLKWLSSSIAICPITLIFMLWIDIKWCYIEAVWSHIVATIIEAGSVYTLEARKHSTWYELWQSCTSNRSINSVINHWHSLAVSPHECCNTDRP